MAGPRIGDGAQDRPSGREILLVGAGGLGMLGGLIWWTVRPPEPAPLRPREVTTSRTDLVGAQACRECHPAEYASFTSSGHARTLRPAGRADVARLVDGQTVADPERPGVTWSHMLRDGRLVAECVERTQSQRFWLDYAFGSGRHAVTFVSLAEGASADPSGWEHRFTYYAHARGLGITPGQAGPTPGRGTSPTGRGLDAELTRKCFDCHATQTSAVGPSTLDPATLVPNVSCERCHGPGRAHVAAARRGTPDPRMPVRTVGATAVAEIRACGTCHRLPEHAPADDIRPGNPDLARFPPIGLLQSRCFIATPGGLSCTACHDPHARVATDAAGYEAVCRSCHEGPSRSICPVGPRSGCLGCHMPRREGDMGMRFTDHWIGLPTTP